MKKRLQNQMRRWLSVCMTSVLLALGIAAGSGGATPVQAAEKIPISSAEDFMNMESNPSGSYYLTKDITLPENMQSLFTEYAQDKRFSGTLDGRGHKLKNYTIIQSSEPESWGHIGIFGYAKNATFKNLSLTNVNININRGKYGAKVGPLVWGEAYGCKFDNIKVSGKITVSSTGKDKDQDLSELEIGGLINLTDGKLTNCSSSLKIKVDGGYLRGLSVGGLARLVFDEKATVKNCSFSGDISVSTKLAGVSEGCIGNNFTVAGICADFSYARVSGCINSGNVTFNMQKDGSIAPSCGIGVYGIGGGKSVYVSSCGNKGKIKISAPNIDGVAEAAGLVGEIRVLAKSNKSVLTKCWNTGSVSATGREARAGGLCIEGGIVSQCYNKGRVSASSRLASSGESQAGGLCAYAVRMQNCYNVGKVSLKGSGYAGGLASVINDGHGDSTGNYSAGTVSVDSHGYRAALFPSSNGGVTITHPRRYLYNNYYTASTGCTAYGLLGQDPVSKRAPRATKVSSITAKNCPKLSSKYWTYSSKYKRMILKNNKEK